jgi:hypothetical protein
MELVVSVEQGMTPLTDDELMAQGGTALPDKEVASVLDLNADLNLGISAAAPIDLGVAANANVAAPIDAAASANVLSFGSESQALADQGTLINQGITGDATAHSVQDSGIDQSTGAPDAAPASTDPATTSPATTDPAAAVPAGTTDSGVVPGGVLPAGTTQDLGAAGAGAAGALNGNLLNVNVNLDANAGIAAPINGAVAANANVAAPIDAAVGANIGSIDSNAYAVAHQDAIINQDIHGDATSSADQQSTLKQ